MGPLNSLAVKKKILINTDKLFLLDQYLEDFLNPFRVCLGMLNNFLVFRRIEWPGFEKRFDAAEHFLLIIAESLLMLGQRQAMFPFGELALRNEHFYEAIENIQEAIKLCLEEVGREGKNTTFVGVRDIEVALQ